MFASQSRLVSPRSVHDSSASCIQLLCVLPSLCTLGPFLVLPSGYSAAAEKMNGTKSPHDGTTAQMLSFMEYCIILFLCPGPTITHRVLAVSICDALSLLILQDVGVLGILHWIFLDHEVDNFITAQSCEA